MAHCTLTVDVSRLRAALAQVPDDRLHLLRGVKLARWEGMTAYPSPELLEVLSDV